MLWLEQMGLRFEGVSDDTLKKLEAIQPDLDHMALVLRNEMPRVNRIAPVLMQVVHEVMVKQGTPQAASPKYAPNPPGPKPHATVEAPPPYVPPPVDVPAYDSKGGVTKSKKKFF